MKLYHFTSLYHLPGILDNGLTIGDVPLTPLDAMNAVWLTTDPTSKSQGWAEGCAFDKTAVRLQVHIDNNDPNLRKWSEFAEECGINKAWYEALNLTGGGGADNWYIYLGAISPGRVIEIANMLRKVA